MAYLYTRIWKINNKFVVSSDIQKAISYYHYRALSHVTTNEVLLRAKDYEESDHTLVNGIPTDVVNEAFQIVGDMYEIHRILGRSVSKLLMENFDPRSCSSFLFTLLLSAI